uniref:Spr_0 protein n=1 Tax=Fopius arisanus TaxID=64838 RepID=A0A0C9PT42_9HYME
MAVELLSGKVFLVITGASQGIGREIAVKFSKLLKPTSTVLLLARGETGLKETAVMVSDQVSVRFQSVDLSIADAAQLSEIITKEMGSSQFERFVIVHNVGSIGDLSKFTTDMNDFNEWRKYYDLNVFSPAVLNSVVMKIVKDHGKAKAVVINITSYLGIQPMKSVGFYCSGKAAREMYFRVFAEEFPQVNVLNYSPGPVETDMLKTFSETAADPEVRTEMSDLPL